MKMTRSTLRNRDAVMNLLITVQLLSVFFLVGYLLPIGGVLFTILACVAHSIAFNEGWEALDKRFFLKDER